MANKSIPAPLLQQKQCEAGIFLSLHLALQRPRFVQAFEFQRLAKAPG
jgi:hypothetical protein